MLQKLECSVCSLCPHKWNVLFQHLEEWFSNHSEVVDKPHIVRGEAEQTANHFDRSWCLPVSHYLNIVGFRCHALSAHDMAEIRQLLLSK